MSNHVIYVLRVTPFTILDPEIAKYIPYSESNLYI